MDKFLFIVKRHQALSRGMLSIMPDNISLQDLLSFYQTFDLGMTTCAIMKFV